MWVSGRFDLDEEHPSRIRLIASEHVCYFSESFELQQHEILLYLRLVYDTLYAASTFVAGIKNEHWQTHTHTHMPVSFASNPRRTSRLINIRSVHRRRVVADNRYRFQQTDVPQGIRTDKSVGPINPNQGTGCLRYRSIRWNKTGISNGIKTRARTEAMMPRSVVWSCALRVTRLAQVLWRLLFVAVLLRLREIDGVDLIVPMTFIISVDSGNGQILRKVETRHYR